jgi:hypothetical protein
MSLGGVSSLSLNHAVSPRSRLVAFQGPIDSTLCTGTPLKHQPVGGQALSLNDEHTAATVRQYHRVAASLAGAKDSPLLQRLLRQMGRQARLSPLRPCLLAQPFPLSPQPAAAAAAAADGPAGTALPSHHCPTGAMQATGLRTSAALALEAPGLSPADAQVNALKAH